LAGIGTTHTRHDEVNLKAIAVVKTNEKQIWKTGRTKVEDIRPRFITVHIS